MKTVIYIFLLTLFCSCGTIYGNPAIDALESEMESLRPLSEGTMEDLERYSKLREIHRSMTQQEKDNQIVKEWIEEQERLDNEPCISMFRLECKNGARI